MKKDLEREKKLSKEWETSFLEAQQVIHQLQWQVKELETRSNDSKDPLNDSSTTMKIVEEFVSDGGKEELAEDLIE